MVSSSLDPRFLRYKSPRSRQYLLRLPAVVMGTSSDARRARLHRHYGISRGRDTPTTGLWARLSRRTLWRGYDLPNVLGPVGVTLSRVRAETPARRSSTYLVTRQSLARARLAREAYNTLYSRRKSMWSSWAVRTMRSRLRSSQHYLAYGRFTRQQAVQRLQREEDPRLGVKRNRSVLHYRTPARRSTKLEYRTEQVIPPAAFELQEMLATSARRWSRFFARDLLSFQRRRSVRTRAY